LRQMLRTLRLPNANAARYGFWQLCYLLLTI
jgi:hypothetical protein